MDKIASPDELQAELRSLLAYAESENPSRGKLAADITALSDRVSTDRVAGTFKQNLVRATHEIYDLNKLATLTANMMEDIERTSDDLYVNGLTPGAYQTLTVAIQYLKDIERHAQAAHRLLDARHWSRDR